MLCPEPPTPGDKERCHLFLVTAEDVLAALESGTSGKSTSRGRLAHTNLCGGGEAHVGGEIWWRDEGAIWLTGGSGRFPPRSEVELNDVAIAFAAAGYDVCNCGWDEETQSPLRVFRGNESWI